MKRTRWVAKRGTRFLQGRLGRSIQMERLQRASILLRLNEELRKSGSWAGETHMQKATFFLQELLAVPLGFDFVLYKHGPFHLICVMS